MSIRTKLRRPGAVALFICAALLAPAASGDQSTIVIPSSGPETFGGVVTNRLNPAFRALLSKSSGGAAPANGPGAAPLAYQDWIDTSTTPPTWKVWSGSQWLVLGTISSTTLTITAPVSSAAPLPGYLFGATLANNGASSLDVASGTATSDDTTTRISLSATLTKTLAAWSAGSSAGGLDTGTAAANTWYHVYLIFNPTTSATDALLSTSATAPTLPSGYTKKRRIGSVLTTGTATNFTNFTQTGDVFIWLSAQQSLNGITPVANADTLFTVQTPPGVKTIARLRMQMNTGSSISMLIRSPDEVNYAGGGNNTFVTAVQTAATTDLLTDTSSRLIYRANAATGQLYVVTWGWTDTRGK